MEKLIYLAAERCEYEQLNEHDGGCWWKKSICVLQISSLKIKPKITVPHSSLHSLQHHWAKSTTWNLLPIFLVSWAAEWFLHKSHYLFFLLIHNKPILLSQVRGVEMDSIYNKIELLDCNAIHISFSCGKFVFLIRLWHWVPIQWMKSGPLSY